MKASDLPRQISVLESQLSNHQAEASTQEERCIKQTQLLSNSLNQISSINREVSRYIEERRDSMLDSCQAQIARLERQSELLGSQLKELNDQLDQLSKQHSEIQVIQRNVDDNLKLRKYSRDIKRIDTDVTRLQSQLASIDRDTIMRRYAELKQRHESLVGEVSAFNYFSAPNLLVS